MQLPPKKNRLAGMTSQVPGPAVPKMTKEEWEHLNYLAATGKLDADKHIKEIRMNGKTWPEFKTMVEKDFKDLPPGKLKSFETWPNDFMGILLVKDDTVPPGKIKFIRGDGAYHYRDFVLGAVVKAD